MATTIPVPIEFSLPEGWLSAPPDEVGVPKAAFVALRPPASRGFTPNITLSGEVRAAEVPMTAVADQALIRLRESASDVQVLQRNELGGPENSGLTQTMRMTAEINGQVRGLVQLQVFIAIRDVNDPHRRAVIELVLTAAEEQFNEVIDDFAHLVETLQPDTHQPNHPPQQGPPPPGQHGPGHPPYPGPGLPPGPRPPGPPTGSGPMRLGPQAAGPYQPGPPGPGPHRPGLNELHGPLPYAPGPHGSGPHDLGPRGPVPPGRGPFGPRDAGPQGPVPHQPGPSRPVPQPAGPQWNGPYRPGMEHP